MFQTFRHGFPHQPTAVAFDPIQRLLAIGTKSGSLRMYPFLTFFFNIHTLNLISIEWVLLLTNVAHKSWFSFRFLQPSLSLFIRDDWKLRVTNEEKKKDELTFPNDWKNFFSKSSFLQVEYTYYYAFDWFWIFTLENNLLFQKRKKRKSFQVYFFD